MVVWWISSQSWVFDWLANRKMIETLIAVVTEAQYFVDRVIKKAADARTPNTVSFCLQIQHLTDHAGFPEKMPVTMRFGGYNVLKFCDHTQ